MKSKQVSQHNDRSGDFVRFMLYSQGLEERQMSVFLYGFISGHPSHPAADSYCCRRRKIMRQIGQGGVAVICCKGYGGASFLNINKKR